MIKFFKFMDNSFIFAVNLLHIMAEVDAGGMKNDDANLDPGRPCGISTLHAPARLKYRSAARTKNHCTKFHVRSQ